MLFFFFFYSVHLFFNFRVIAVPRLTAQKWRTPSSTFSSVSEVRSTSAKLLVEFRKKIEVTRGCARPVINPHSNTLLWSRKTLATIFPVECVHLISGFGELE